MRSITLLALLSTIVFTQPTQADLFGLGYFSRVDAVSADGTVVVGKHGDVFRWTEESGKVALPEFFSANGISDDGSVIVGSGRNGEAFRWSVENGSVGLGAFSDSSVAYCVSGDGSVVFGSNYTAQPNDWDLFRWTENTGMENVTDLNGEEIYYGFGNATTTDGAVVVGSAKINGVTPEAFRFSNGVVEGLGFLPDYTSSYGNDASNNAEVIVGYCRSTPGNSTNSQGFRWKMEDGMNPIASPWKSYETSRANAVSENGSIVVGFGIQQTGRTYLRYEAFRWTQETGILSLKSCLLAQGDDVSEWDRLVTCEDISADGSTIIGIGLHALTPDFDIDEGYVAKVDSQLTPDSMFVSQGVQVSGSLDALVDLDEQALVLRRRVSDVEPEIEFSFTATSPTLNPTRMTLAVQAGSLSRSPITQEISLYDFENELWEVVDVRTSNKSGTALAVGQGVGELSRFVEPDTLQAKARVLFEGQIRRGVFSTRIDMVRITLSE